MPLLIIAVIIVAFVIIDSHLRINKANIERNEERTERMRVTSEAEKIKFESALYKAGLASAQFERDQQMARLHEAINENDELKVSLSKYQAKEEQSQINHYRGLAYEIQIGELLGKDAVSVFYRGIIRGKKDNSIDLVITTKDEILLIQCKNHSIPWILHYKEASSFCLSVEEYNAPVNFRIRPMLVCTSNTSCDYEVDKLFRARKIEIVRIPFDESYMNDIESRLAAIKTVSH